MGRSGEAVRSQVAAGSSPALLSTALSNSAPHFSFLYLLQIRKAAGSVSPFRVRIIGVFAYANGSSPQQWRRTPAMVGGRHKN